MLEKGDMPPLFNEMTEKSAKAAAKAAVDKYQEDERLKYLGGNKNQVLQPTRNEHDRGEHSG